MNPIDIVFQVLGDVNEMTSKVNAACADHHLPNAFDGLKGNPDYRFEGFGVAFQGIQPELTFWVHYKPGSLEHVSLDRFEIPINYSQALALVAHLGHPSRAAA